ncbi:hypothetical protein CK203_086047 [Vitis vinifera]|uniref:Uncharacterized protein n=1 Tax=Vitis vinifera TaxID=29760 RepID=A0A438D545_VITVI|nr:hypothetical protein CK203_086047 [Vitis vinifera]
MLGAQTTPYEGSLAVCNSNVPGPNNCTKIGGRPWCEHCHRTWTYQASLLGGFFMASLQIGNPMKVEQTQPVQSCPPSPNKSSPTLGATVVAQTTVGIGSVVISQNDSEICVIGLGIRRMIGNAEDCEGLYLLQTVDNPEKQTQIARAS